MKINYPQIDWADVRAGDMILSHWIHSNGVQVYREYTVQEPKYLTADDRCVFYLIDRPKPAFPEDYGTLILAKKVRGIEFPDGIVLARQRGSWNEYSSQGPMWKSLAQRVEGKDNHSERQIEDWVLAKAVPAE